MRGLPGSGKSTKACEILSKELNMSVIELKRNIKLKNDHILSTDNYFTTYDDQGNEFYQFDVKKIYANHKKNQRKTKEQLENGVTPLFIDNTNTVKKEMKEYVKMAKQYGYKIVILDHTSYTSEKNPIFDSETNTWNFELLKQRNEDRRKFGKFIPIKTIERMMKQYNHTLSLSNFK